MNELFKLTRQHYEKNETEASLLSKVTKILESLPDGSVDSSALAGLDQFHVMGLAATEELAQMAAIERGSAILDAGSGLGGPSRYLAGFTITAWNDVTKEALNWIVQQKAANSRI
jgi:sarcosine/dimethylglycine N-methyltransferase